MRMVDLIEKRETVMPYQKKNSTSSLMAIQTEVFQTIR